MCSVLVLSCSAGDQRSPTLWELSPVSECLFAHHTSYCIAPIPGGIQGQAGCGSGQPGLVAGPPLCPAGAVELWELDEKETLIVNKFCKYEHDDMVEAVDVLAGSTRAVSGGRDFSVKVWDLPQQAVLHSYRAHSDAVTCVAACPGKDTIFLSCAEDERILLWDTRCPKPATRIVCSACNYLPTSVLWHPQESDIFALGDESGTVALVDTKNPDSALSSIVHARRVTGFAFSAHSSPLLASISEDCTVAVLNSDLSEVFRSRSHRDFVKGLSWSPSDDALLTTVGWDHQVLHHTVPIPTGEASGINCVKE
uniref:Methylosome protein WDR77 n=1 Tax=Meleagris gallopavo TaxID=9103 RepID=G1MZ87_MELGA